MRLSNDQIDAALRALDGYIDDEMTVGDFLRQVTSDVNDSNRASMNTLPDDNPVLQKTMAEMKSHIRRVLKRKKEMRDS